MYRNYFVVDGEKYYTGTIFTLNEMGKEVEATFICYDTEHNRYIYRIDGCTWRSSDKYFQKFFIAVTDKRDSKEHMPVKKKMNEFNISGMFLGWVWYIFLMLIIVLFRERIGLWILTTAVFFSWRSNKIKKEGTYIEW